MSEGQPEGLLTRVEAAAVVGVRPSTLGGWVRRGWLPEGPWTRAQVEQAAAGRPGAARRRPLETHGETGWAAGCRCDACRVAHNADTNRRRRARREQEWALVEDRLLRLLAGGASPSDAAAVVGVHVNTLAAARHRDPEGAGARLDAALVAGRDPGLPHGAGGGWRGGCRCPECRAWHEQTRGAARRTNRQEA